MDDSIETIWKEAFVDPSSLQAPRVVDLYNRKSTHILDRLERMFRVNIQAIVVAAVVLAAGSLPLGVPIAGCGLALCLAVVLWVSYREHQRLQQIDKGDSSYDYLKAFAAWRRDAMQRFTRVYRVIYPAIVLTFAAGLWYSDLGERALQSLLTEVPDLTLIGGIPASLLLLVLGVALVMCLFAGPIYRLDINLIYGRQFGQLEEILADMEALRA